MRIGVEVPVDRDLLEVRLGELLGQRPEVVLDARHLRDVVDLDAADALHRQHFLRRVRLDDARDEQARESRQRAPERRRVARLDPVVELVDERHLELLDDADEIDALAGARVIGEEVRELAEKLDVVGEALADARALRLDDDGSPVAQRGVVDLPEARAAERLRIELREQLADARAELLLDDLLDLGEGNRIDVVLEMLQLVDVGLGQEIGPRGQHLAELDVRRAELDESLAERACALDDAVAVGGWLFFGVVSGEPFDPLPLREILEAVAREQADRRGETRQIAR